MEKISKEEKAEFLDHLDFLMDCTKGAAERFGRPLYPPIVKNHEKLRSLIENMEVTE